MCSLFSSIVYLTLDTFYKVGKPVILLGTHAMFTDMVRGSLQFFSRYVIHVHQNVYKICRSHFLTQLPLSV